MSSDRLAGAGAAAAFWGRRARERERGSTSYEVAVKGPDASTESSTKDLSYPCPYEIETNGQPYVERA